jgi:signal transduction histidine kinase
MGIILDLQNSILIVTAVINLLLGILIYVKHRNLRANQIYTVNIIFIVSWILAMIAYRTVDSNLAFWTTILYVTPTLIASTFAYFTLFFAGTQVKYLKLKTLIIFGLNAIIVFLTVSPGYIINSVTYLPDAENIIHFGPLYLIYAFYISSLFSFGLLVLLLDYHKAKTKIARQKIVYLLAGYLFASILAMFTNLIFPWMGFFDLNWLGQVLTLFMVIPVAYAIFRHKLFDTRVIATELLTLSLVIFLLVRSLIPQSANERLVNVILLLGGVFIGVLLMRSVNKEVAAREKVQELAGHLEDANVRLKELDRQKSEFLSMAAHQLRTPLTSIKGYASLMLEGSYGNLPDKVDNVLETIFASSARMVDTVSDFLNVSRIEQGKMEYRMENTDLGILAKSVVTELALSAREKKLELNYHDDGKEPYPIYADVSKLEHVISNLVDNAIKYTPKGAVSVRVEKDSMRGVGVVKVIDTGAGIPAEALPKLFDKFVRARNAHEINVTGTGLGLYVAREMMDKHDGKIWAESKGEGKGSTFFVEIPLAETSIT